MKSKSEARFRREAPARAAAMVDDLNAVRTVVLNKQRELNPAEHASLERRLFESWVIEQLARFHCQQAQAADELAELKEEFEAVDEELRAARKELARVTRLTAKKAAK